MYTMDRPKRQHHYFFSFIYCILNSLKTEISPSLHTLFSTYAPRGGGGGSCLLYVSIAYYRQKGGEGVQIACKIAYVLTVHTKQVRPCDSSRVSSLSLTVVTAEGPCVLGGWVLLLIPP